MKWLEKLWKKWTKDYNIVIKSIELHTAYILVINFTCDDKPMYLVIDGNYKEIRKKYLQDNKCISFNEYMEEINLLVPAKDVVLSNIKKWKAKL